MARAGGLPLPTITDDRALGDAKIQRSLRFNRGDSPYLSRALGSPTSDDKASVSVWLKRTDVSTDNTFFDNYQGTNDRLSISLVSSTDGDALGVYQRDSSGIVCNLLTTQKFRDASAWYHLLIAFDTTQGTAADRVKIYVNGTQVTSFSSSTYFSQNHNLRAGSGYTTNVGRYGAGSNYFGGYLAEFNYIDGQQLSPTDVGFTDSQTGIWMPKRYEGTYGNNGFHLDFNDRTSTTTLGIDKSPNGNDFTLTNLAVTDSMLDTPSNNFPTLRLMAFPPSSGSTTITQGGLRFRTGTTGNGGGGKRTTVSTMSVKSGKWYFEVIDDSEMMYGIGSTYQIRSSDSVDRPRYLILDYDGYVYYNGGYRQYGDTNGYTADSDISQIYIDMDAPDTPVVYFGRNGQWGNNTGNSGTAAWNSATPINGMRIADYQSDIFTTDDAQGFMCFMQSSRGGGNDAVSTVNFGQDSTFTGQKSRGTFTDANGRGEFLYQPPKDALALCAANLPITTPSIIRPQKHFDTILYTGNNTTGRSITDLEFKPDLVWIKDRSSGDHGWYDSVRGVSKRIKSNSSDAESDVPIGSFDPNGFSFASEMYYNANSANYAAWCWKAGGATTVSNTDGSVTSAVSANQEAGFSIVTYTGPNGNGTIGHGLGKAPKWIVIRRRDNASTWTVYHESIGNTHRLGLDLSQGSSSSSAWWNNTSPTSTTFSVGTDAGHGGSTDGYVAYCWTDITGYSKFGTYTGNGNSDGQFVHLGFRPAFVLIKSTSASENWQVRDNKRNGYNDANYVIFANGDGGDYTSAQMDFLSNGFKLRNGGGGSNGSDETLVYMAFAEQPEATSFGTSPNAR